MKRNLYLRIFSYFIRYKYLVLLGLLLSALSVVSQLAGPYFIKLVIDDYIIDSNSHQELLNISMLFIAILIIGAIASFYQTYLFNSIGQKIMYRIRLDLFSHLQRMPMSFFDRNTSGRIMTRVTNDVEALNEMYSGVLVVLFKDVFILAGIVVAMLKMDLQLALVSFSVIPVLILAVYLYRRKAIPNYRKVRGLIGRINGFLAENISGMRIVQIFNREREKYKEFQDLNEEYRKVSIVEVILMALFKPSSELINYIGITLLVGFAVSDVFHFDINLKLGILIAFISYIKKFFDPINELADKFNVILSGGVAADRIFEMMDNDEGEEEPDRGDELEKVNGVIEFKNVWFSYDDENWVLKGVSFTVKAGETIAFVGATGSGKTTIINLIGRFYEIQKGSILIDGKDIRDISLRSLRKHIAVVMQDVFLFSGDIMSNISLENPDIDDEKIIESSKYASSHSFISQLPGKYMQKVGERGCILSSGQRQLISFARAVAFDPKILVLDEATASIDTNTEKLVQESLEKISRERTTLVVAHRLSTIRNADKIIVIEQGEIKEMGRHDELIERQGVYKNLCEMQFEN